MRIIVLLLSIGIMLYSLALHRREGNRNFYFLAYWKTLTPKGAAIYTAGLILLIYSVLFW